MTARASELLSVPYYHVVFTLPEAMARLALQNQRVLYGLLFRAAAETLQDVAANPKHLGARIGGLAVLHTWGQNLMHHPHVHCVIPGGGLSLDESRWIPCRDGFFLPVRILSRVFRGKFLDFLRRAYQRGQLVFAGELANLAVPDAFEPWLDATVRTDWVVYAKAPFGGPEHVLKYLARYTHRVAISNQRLVEMADGQVRFRWKNYAEGNTQRIMTLSAEEFLRRFLMHVLPKGFVKIRHFGFLANRHRRKNLAIARRLLQGAPSHEALASTDARPAGGLETGDRLLRCPACNEGHLIVVETFRRQARWQVAISDAGPSYLLPVFNDSS